MDRSHILPSAVVIGVVLLAGCGGFLGGESTATPEGEAPTQAADAQPSDPTPQEVVDVIQSSKIENQSYTAQSTSVLRDPSGEPIADRYVSEKASIGQGSTTQYVQANESAKNINYTNSGELYKSGGLLYVPGAQYRQAPPEAETVQQPANQPEWVTVNRSVSPSHSSTSLSAYRQLLASSNSTQVTEAGETIQVQIVVSAPELRSAQRSTLSGVGFGNTVGNSTVVYSIDSDTKRIQTVAVNQTVVADIDGRQELSKNTTIEYTYEPVNITLPEAQPA